MGNTLTIQENEVTRNRFGAWNKLSEAYGCSIVESETGLRAEEYQIPLDEKSWELNNIKIYQFRRVQNSHLVRVFNVQPDSFQHTLTVRTELIPHRLADIADLTPEESLYVALYALIGFRYVYELCQRRLFSVNDSMIGFTPQGNVKVWINSNLVSNQLDVAAFKANPVRCESDLVTLILNSVAKHTRGGSLPERFLIQYNSKPSRSIADTLRCFKAFLQSENVNIANRVDFAGKVTGNNTPTHGFYRQAEGQLYQTPIREVERGSENHSLSYQQPLGKLYTDGVASETHLIPSIEQQIPRQAIQRQQDMMTEGGRSTYSQNQTLFSRNQGFQRVPPSQITGETRGIFTSQQLSRNPYEQQFVPHPSYHIDPRIVRTSSLGYNPRGHAQSHAQSQIYTRQGTNNFPLPSSAVSNVNFQRGLHGSVYPHYQPQPNYRRTPVAEAQLAPAIGATTKVIGVAKFGSLVVQQGKVNRTELKTQKEINEAMNPLLNLNKTYLNSETNQPVKYIQLENLEEIKKHRAPTSEDYVSGQNRSSTFVDPSVQKMMFPEQVHFNNPINNISTPVSAASGPNYHNHNLVQSKTLTQHNNQRDPSGRNIRSYASNMSSENRSQYSSLSKKSNRSFKADKLILMNGRAIHSNPIEITEVNNQTPIARTETTIYHEISSYGLQPTIKEESPYSYRPSAQVRLETPTNPYRIGTEIIEEQVQYNIRYK